jgi:hypothetical protein
VHRLGELGSCHLVAQAMRTFPNERYIQLLGFEAIEALAANSEPNRNHFENVRPLPCPSRSRAAWAMGRRARADVVGVREDPPLRVTSGSICRGKHVPYLYRVVRVLWSACVGEGGVDAVSCHGGLPR